MQYSCKPLRSTLKVGIFYYIYILYRYFNYDENKIGIKIEKIFAQCELHYIESVWKCGKPFRESTKSHKEAGDFPALCIALPSYMQIYVTIAYKVGWRMSEITGLTWNQVDLNQGVVRLEPSETKNDEGRTFTLMMSWKRFSMTSGRPEKKVRN